MPRSVCVVALLLVACYRIIIGVGVTELERKERETHTHRETDRERGEKDLLPSFLRSFSLSFLFGFCSSLSSLVVVVGLEKKKSPWFSGNACQRNLLHVLNTVNKEYHCSKNN